MQTCPSCAARIGDGLRFCTACGKSLVLAGDNPESGVLDLAGMDFSDRDMWPNQGMADAGESEPGTGFCARCGTLFPDDPNFCRECGQALRGPSRRA